MNAKNPYKVLGIESSATPDEIKSAYRKMAKKYHPDVNSDETSKAMFQEVQDAYDTLTNKKPTGSTYNQRAWDHPDFSGMESFFSFFDNLSSRQTVQFFDLNLPLETLHKGGAVDIINSGSKFSLKIEPGTLPGSILVQQVDGKIYKIMVLAQPHKYFSVNNKMELWGSAKVSLNTILLGGKLNLNDLDNKVLSITIPKLHDLNKPLRISGKGFAGNDLFIKLTLSLPKELTPEEEKFIRTHF